jgi:hypothetical protein
VHRSFRNSLLKFWLRTARSRRGRLRRSGAQVKTKPCPGEVLGQERGEGAEGDREGVEAHQKMSMPSGSSGGAAGSGSGRLAAIFARVWRGNECRVEGV